MLRSLCLRAQRRAAVPLYARAASSSASSMLAYHGTTIVCVRRGDSVAMVGDGQVTLGSTVVKPNARKVRTSKGIMCGFAGSTADALTLYERLNLKLEEYPGQLLRACVELAKAWRMDKYLRRLEATMIVADANVSLTLTGNGDVIEPNDDVVGIGSGGPFATAAATALLHNTELPARDVAVKAMEIASDLCIYTNRSFTIATIPEENGEDVKE